MAPLQSTSRISDDLKMAAARMAKVFPTRMVGLFLNISAESVRRAARLYEETGDVCPIPTGNRCGQPPILDPDDLKVTLSGISVYIFIY
jgi:hypothetical protein